jgi:hypothetical protein
VLHLGFNILLCDIDAVWLEDPMPYLSRSYDLQAQPEADGRLCGGFMFMLSSQSMQKFWGELTAAHTKVGGRVGETAEMVVVVVVENENENENRRVDSMMDGQSGLKTEKGDGGV